MSEQKSLLTVGDPVFVDSLLTREEYNYCQRSLKYTTLTTWDSRVETRKFSIERLEKWRNNLVTKDEIRIYNNNIDKLLKTVS